MIYSKTCSQSHEREYTLCFDRWYIFFPLFNLNQLYKTKFTLSSNWVLLEKHKHFFWIENNFLLLCCNMHRCGLNSYGIWFCIMGVWLSMFWGHSDLQNSDSHWQCHTTEDLHPQQWRWTSDCAHPWMSFFTCCMNMRYISNLVPPHTQNFFTLHFEMIMSLTTLLSKSEVYFINWIITVCHKICNFICNSWSSLEWMLHMTLLALCR